MNAREINGKDGSKIMMTLANSTGTWLNGCLQSQHYYVHIEIKDPNGKLLAQVGLSYEQAARMLLYNGEVDCTLQRYRDETGKMAEELVTPPETVQTRMKKRLEDVEGSLVTRLQDIQKDLYDMVNGHVKPGKTNLEELMGNVDTVLNNLTSNREFVAQETQKEMAEMQSNMAGQLGLLIQTLTGTQVTGETLRQLLPVSDGPLLIGTDVDPVIDVYTPKERRPVPIENMTAMEVADAIQERLTAIERRMPHNEKETHLYIARASHTPKGKVSILYVNYQGGTTIDLELAKEYLKFLRSMTKVSQFKTHYQLKDKR